MKLSINSFSEKSQFTQLKMCFSQYTLANKILNIFALVLIHLPNLDRHLVFLRL